MVEVVEVVVEIATATAAAAEADTADNQAPSSLLPRKCSELSKGIKRISGQEAGIGASLNAPHPRRDTL
jgi:hypothetical protein